MRFAVPFPVALLVALMVPGAAGDPDGGGTGCADGVPAAAAAGVAGTAAPVTRLRFDAERPFPQARFAEGVSIRIEWTDASGACEVICPFTAGPGPLPSFGACSKPFFQGMSPVFVEVSGEGAFFVCDHCMQQG